MRNIWTIARKELISYFRSPIAYSVLAMFALLFGYFYYQQLSMFILQSLTQAQYAQMYGENAAPMNVNEMVIRPLLYTTGVLCLFLVPMITMRLFAEEKKTGNEQPKSVSQDGERDRREEEQNFHVSGNLEHQEEHRDRRRRREDASKPRTGVRHVKRNTAENQEIAVQGKIRRHERQGLGRELGRRRLRVEGERRRHEKGQGKSQRDDAERDGPTLELLHAEKGEDPPGEKGDEAHLP